MNGLVTETAKVKTNVNHLSKHSPPPKKKKVMGPMFMD